MITEMVVCVATLLFAEVPVETTQAQPQAEQKTKANAAPTTNETPVGQAATAQTPTGQEKAASPGQPSAPTAEAAAEPAEPEEKEVDGVKLQAIEANIVSYTNQERTRYGLPALQVDKELMDTAREHAAWMTRTQNMAHTRRAVAENIAMGQPHSSDVVRSWMNSSGHRANILSAGHGRIGVAAYRTAGGTIFWCQQFRR
jgi:uncharacterized protein YkwD